jgi:hypothetical protein
VSIYNRRYKEIQESNLAKRGANKATGVLLLSTAIASNIVGYALSFIGLSPLVSLLSAAMWIAILALLVWMYCVVTGEFSFIRDQMDEVADLAMPHVYAAVSHAAPKMISAAAAIKNSQKKTQ